MKVIVAGSRWFQTGEYLDSVVAKAIDASEFHVCEIVSGGAQGVDRCGERLAVLKGVPCKRIPAKWAIYGASAGPRRNAEMAKYADALVAVWDGKSRGTKNMIATMQRAGKEVYQYVVTEEQSKRLTPVKPPVSRGI